MSVIALSITLLLHWLKFSHDPQYTNWWSQSPRPSQSTKASPVNLQEISPCPTCRQPWWLWPLCICSICHDFDGLVITFAENSMFRVACAWQEYFAHMHGKNILRLAMITSIYDGDKSFLYYRYIPRPNKNGCINRSMVQKFEYDLFYTDIVGAFHVMYFSGPYWSEVR